MDYLGIPKEVFEYGVATLALVVALVLVWFVLRPLVLGFVRKDERDDQQDDRAADERRVMIELMRQMLLMSGEQIKTFAAITEAQKAITDTQKEMKLGFADLGQQFVVQYGEFFRAARAEMQRITEQRDKKIDTIHRDIQVLPETVRSAVEQILADYENRFNAKIQAVPEETRLKLMPLIQTEIHEMLTALAPQAARLEELSQTLDRLLAVQRERELATAVESEELKTKDSAAVAAEGNQDGHEGTV